jgi:EPS-associated MarR family transcriptional regulator
MIEQNPQEEILNIFKEIETNPKATQRTISCNLGISLGKTNYLLKELIKKGLVKVKNFSDNPEKLKRISYFLTKKGLKQKIRLLHLYLQIKEAEYNRIKRECKLLSVHRH